MPVRMKAIGMFSYALNFRSLATDCIISNNADKVHCGTQQLLHTHGIFRG